MKKQFPAILAAAACLLLLIALFRIRALENRLDSLQSDLSRQIARVNDNVSDIYGRVADAAAEAASPLAASSFSYGAADTKAQTVELVCTVFPKEYTPGRTEASVTVNGSAYPMALENGGYTATVAVPIAADTTVEGVSFSEDGAVRYVSLMQPFSPRYEYLPLIYGRFESNGSGSVQHGVYVLENEGLAVIDVDRKNSGVSLRSLALVFLLDGEETGRMDVDMTYAGQQAYLAKVAGSSAHALPDEAAFLASGASEYYCHLDRTFEIPLGSTLECYVEAVDRLGLRYRALFDLYEIDQTGAQSYNTEKWMRIGAEPDIYDADGNVLYALEPSLYA